MTYHGLWEGDISLDNKKAVLGLSYVPLPLGFSYIPLPSVLQIWKADELCTTNSAQEQT